MQEAEAGSAWFVPFVAACVAALALGAAFLATWAGRAADRRRIAAALGTLGGNDHDPVRGARVAAGQAVRLDSALAELRAIVETAPVGIVALDRLDRIVTINPAAQRLLDAENRPVEGRLIVEFARSPELDALISGARETGRRADAELRFSSASGQHVARCAVVPLARAAGTAQVLLVLEDRTELRRLEALRTEFVANVSHELRTPITSIRGYAETLVDGFDLGADADRFVKTIARSAARLGAIIDDLLLLSSLEDPNSRAQLPPVPVRIAGIVAEAIEQVTPAAREKRIAMEVAVDPRLWVAGNAGLLAHAVANLVSNAVKYGPADSRVRVEARPDGGIAEISVADRGPGIPEVHQARLFERFFRVDRARSRDSGGTGLGLAIVKHVAQVHGGTVSVESRTDSEHGTTFRIRLPLVDPETARNPGSEAAADAPARPSRQSA